MMKYTINFFDFGTHKGQEIDHAIKCLTKEDISYKIYSFEANPLLSEELKEKYKSNKNVKINNVAIASVTGKFICLYKDVSPKAYGSSIYKDKKNVTEDAFKVHGTKFSDWLYTNNVCLKKHINILKANIEGAEYDLFIDLEKKDLLKHFHLFFCASTLGGFSRDMLKIVSLSHKAKELDQLMVRNNIQQEVFTLKSKNHTHDIDLAKRIKEVVRIEEEHENL